MLLSHDLSERNPESYKERLNKVISCAGKGDAGWNKRFLSALDGMDLDLADPAEFDNTPELYPDRYPCQAPRYYGAKAEWAENSLIVWRT
jgi:hypothetical protein